jgi:hypothetical protein
MERNSSKGQETLLPVFSLIAAIIDCTLSNGIFTAFVGHIDCSRARRRVEMECSEELRRLEERLLEPSVRKNPVALREEFVEIRASGTQYDREAIIAALESETRRRWSCTTFAQRSWRMTWSL